MRRVNLRTSYCIALVMLLGAACAGTQSGAPSITALRAEAAMNPRNAAALRRVALAEAFAAEGDAQSADAALARAVAIDPKSVRLHFVQGLMHDAHGRPSQAFDAYAKALTLSFDSRDPIAPHLGELSVHAISTLEGSVPGYLGKAQAALTPLLGDARVATPVRFSAASLLMQLAYRQGSRPRAQDIAVRAGCLTEFRVAGPFGPRQLLGFDERYAVKPGVALAASYDLGPDAGVQATRSLGARGCSVNLGGGPVARGGTSFAQAYIDTPKAGQYLLRLESPSSAEISVDGERVLRVDRRKLLQPEVTWLPIELAAGRHELLIKITSGHPNPAIALSVVPLRPNDPFAIALPFESDTDSGFAKYVRAASAAARGDVLGARASLQGISASSKSAALLSLLRAGLFLGDPLYPTQMREDEARRLFSAALARDPELWSAALQLSAMMSGNGRTKEAIMTLREASKRWPAVPSIGLALASLLRGEDWDAEADAVIAKVRAVVPDACMPLSAELEALRARQRGREAAEAVTALMACEAQSNARFAQLTRERRFDEAAVELERLAALDPPQNRYAWMLARLEMAKQRSDDRGIDEQIELLRTYYPRSENGVTEIVDRLLGRGDSKAALQALSEALGKEPASLADLHRLLPVLGGEHVLADYRLSGRQVIADFESSGRRYDAAQVLVLDYMMARIFEDGSSLELVHTIEKAQSDEAIDKIAEVEVPEAARVLTLQAIKPDGRRLEPDAIAGKDTISLPNVTPGDYVELEYIIAKPASSTFARGYLGERFYFKSFEIPFDHSHMVVVLPKRMDIRVDPRGPAPAVQTREVGELRELTFKVQESKALVPEPDAVSPREYLPSVRLAAHATWQEFTDSIRDLLVDRDVYDPQVDALVQQIVAGASEPRVRAERLYAWVLENIENNEDIFSQAAVMLRARAGNRARVLHYLLQLAGVRSTLGLVRSVGADITLSEIADSDTYEHLLVTLDGERGPIWLFTVERYAPFGYVPPALLGQPALLLDAKHSRVRLPGHEPGQSLRRVVLDITMKQGGQAYVSAVETVHGQGAVTWRRELETVPDAEIEHRFEAEYVSRLMPGARLVKLAIDDRQRAASEITLRYDFEVSTLGRRVGESWALPAMLTNNLAANFAQLAQRTTDELVPSPVEIEVVLRIHGPKGAAGFAVPEPVRLDAAVPGRPTFSMTSRIENDALIVERRLSVPQTRIAPKEYSAFASFCRMVDTAEAKELVLRLP